MRSTIEPTTVAGDRVVATRLHRIDWSGRFARQPPTARASGRERTEVQRASYVSPAITGRNAASTSVVRVAIKKLRYCLDVGAGGERRRPTRVVAALAAGPGVSRPASRPGGATGAPLGNQSSAASSAWRANRRPRAATILLAPNIRRCETGRDHALSFSPQP